MRIEPVIIEDQDKSVFFVFIRQFPAVCAQGQTMEEAAQKVNTYWKKFVDTMKDQEVDLAGKEVISM